MEETVQNNVNGEAHVPPIPEMKCIDGWLQEARAVIDDVQFAVSCIAVSQVLPVTSDGIYLNIETKDGQRLCVHMSSQGFCVVAEDYDKVETNGAQNEHFQYFETPYSLLNKYSPLFTQTFANALCEKLETVSSLEKSHGND